MELARASDRKNTTDGSKFFRGFSETTFSLNLFEKVALDFFNTLIGADPAGGITKLLYDSSWKKAQETLRSMFSTSGMESHYDQVGNLFGMTMGTEYPDELVLTGSHIDTVQNGGALDGQ